jgi:toxin ParE1/3/4
MSRYEFTDQAKEDLFEIAAYVSLDNEQAALQLVDRIHDRCQSLAENPRMGRTREELAPGLRSKLLGNYLIFYRPTEYGVQVVRLLHGGRNLKTLFADFQD